MQILWIHAQNFKCYSNVRIPETGILPKGLIFIEGENSTGKTSLFRAIYYAFFYDPSKSQPLGTKDSIIKRGESGTKVEIAFEVSNKYYAVQRYHSKNKPVDAIFLEIDPQEALQGNLKIVKKIAEGSKDVNDKIVSLLNIDHEKVLSTLIVNQGEVQMLAEAKGAKLRDLIYQLFQLEQYKDKLKAVVRKKIECIEDEIEKNRIVRTSEDILNEIEEIDESIESSYKTLQIKEKEIQHLEEEIKKYPKIDELQTIRDLKSDMERTGQQIMKKKRALSEESSRFNLQEPLSEKIFEETKAKINSKIQDLQLELEKEEQEKDKIKEERFNLNKDLKSIEERKKKLLKLDQKEDESFVCEVCEQEMDYEHYKELIERLTNNIPAIQKGLLKKDKLIQEKNAEIKKLEKSKRDLELLLISLEELRKDFSEIQTLEQSRDNFQDQLITVLKKFNVSSTNELSQKYDISEFDEFYKRINELNISLNKLIAEKKYITKDIQEKEEKKKQLQSQIEENKRKEEEIEKLNKEIALIKRVEDYVAGFITEDLIANRLIAGIQNATSSNIYLFTRGKYSELYLEPTTQKTLTLSIKDEDDGFIKDQNYLSGGDKAAIGLGLRIGISELLKRVRPLKDSKYNPPRMDIMILDEPLGALDEDRRKKVIEGLMAQNKFSQIFLITHTNIRQELQAPMILVERTAKGNKATFYHTPTQIEMESES
ncbi:MAG: AAA family ATPase [Candidatus Heimdallarchaeaceae archaeon]